MVPIDLMFEDWSSLEKVSYTLPPIINPSHLKEIKESMIRGQLPLEIIFSENGKQLRVKTKEKIGLNSDLIDGIEKKYGILVRIYL